MLAYKRSGCGFESDCCHLNVRYRACFEKAVSWHSGYYKVYIRSGTRQWNDNHIELNMKLKINCTDDVQCFLKCFHSLTFKILLRNHSDVAVFFGIIIDFLTEELDLALMFAKTVNEITFLFSTSCKFG